MEMFRRASGSAPSDAASLCAAYVNMLEFAAQREAGGVWRRESSSGWQVDAGGEWSTVVDQGLKRIVCQDDFLPYRNRLEASGRILSCAFNKESMGIIYFAHDWMQEGKHPDVRSIDTFTL